MTGNKILTTAFSFLGEKPTGNEATEFALGWLNLLLQESFRTENSIRRADGTAVLTAAPELKSLDDDVPYADSITRAALPYGLAAFICSFNDLDDLSLDNRNKYIAALDEASKMVPEDIVDVYGGDEDA